MVAHANAHSPLPAAPAPGLVIGGRYVLDRAVSGGGMGSLWAARHTRLDVEVAVKILRHDLLASPAARRRFEREAKMLAGLRSAHVVSVHDFGVEGDLPYLVMELLHGEDLARRLERELRLSLPAARAVLAQIGKGLRRAHEAGLVHRDLKPANVFIALIDGEDTVKIVDFGIAKDLTERRIAGEGTRTGELMGSPRYMSPEQMRGAKDVDHRTDLWSLAVILFEAITGVLPFDADDPGALMAQVLTDPIPPASAFALDLHAAFDAFFFRALARDPDRRFQSVRDLVAGFDAAVDEAEAAAAPRRASGDVGPTLGGPLASTVRTLAGTRGEVPGAGAAANAVTMPAEGAGLRGTPRRAPAALGGALVGLALGLAVSPVFRRAPRAEAPVAPLPSATAAAPPVTGAPSAAEPEVLPAGTVTAAPTPSTSASADPRKKSEWGFGQWGF